MTSGSLELELEMFVCHQLWVLGTELRTLQEQQELLTAEPSLSAILVFEDRQSLSLSSLIVWTDWPAKDPPISASTCITEGHIGTSASYMGSRP